MSSYVRYPLHRPLGADILGEPGKDWFKMMQHKYSHLKNGWLQILRDMKVAVETGPSENIPKIRVINTKVKYWIIQLEALMKPYTLESEDAGFWDRFMYALQGKSMAARANAQSLYIILGDFEKQLDQYAKELEAITGKPQSEGTRIRKELAKEPSWLDKMIDLMWEPIKIAAVVGGGYLLYQYLEKQTRYPSNRLPSYAGGKRR